MSSSWCCTVSIFSYRIDISYAISVSNFTAAFINQRMSIAPYNLQQFLPRSWSNECSRRYQRVPSLNYSRVQETWTTRDYNST